MRLLAALLLIASLPVAAQTLTIDVDPAAKIEEAIQTAVVKLINQDAGLTKEYSEKMDAAYDYLDPEDPVRISAADVANLSEWSLSEWVPTLSFRYGQGDYSYCTGEDEMASYNMGTVIVGFNTSYKREETYGFWAVYDYTYDFCNSDSDDTDSDVTKARIRLEHRKWVSSEAVSQLLY